MANRVTQDDIDKILEMTSIYYQSSSEGKAYRRKMEQKYKDNFFNLKKIHYLLSEKIIVYENKKKEEFSFRQKQCAWLVKFLLKIRDSKLRQDIIRWSDFSPETKENLSELYGKGMTEKDWEEYHQELINHREKAKLRKSQKRLTDLCLSNEFDLFFTLTFNPDIIDSFDYDSVKQALTKFLESMRKKHGRFDYIFVIELHRSGRAHCHGLTNKLSLSFTPKLNKKNQPIIENNHDVFDCVEWSSKYGFGEYSRIDNLESASHYISKYVTKDMFQLAPGKKRYLCSQGLNRPNIEYDEINLDDNPINDKPVMIVQDWDKDRHTAYDKIKIYSKKIFSEHHDEILTEQHKETKIVATPPLQGIIKKIIETTTQNT